MFRRKLMVLMVVLLCASMYGPAEADAKGDRDLLTLDWEAVVQRARGGEVRFYMWGGWAHVNGWVDGYVAREMKKRYGITVKRTPMDPPTFLNKLLAEKAAGRARGSIDLLWINGENFRNAARTGLLFGPFAPRLPNFKAYVDPDSVSHDFGYPVQGREAPYGRAQFVFEHDSARTPAPPTDATALKAWIKANPGRFTYPQPPDFTGSAFIRQLFCALTGGHGQYMAGFDEDLFSRQAPKLWAWLNEVKPHLWQKGRTYPKSSAALDTLFARGEVDFNMSYHPAHAQSKIVEGAYPETVRTFVMTDGSIFNTHFTTIPFNAPHKAAAMVLADFLLSPEAQLAKYEPSPWGDFPALDMARLPTDWQARFKAVDLGRATLSPAALAGPALPEIPSAYLEALEAGWEANVLRR